MARCSHGFELSQVQCPDGCGGVRKQQRQVTKVANPRAAVERVPRRAPAEFTDEQLRVALADATSLADAATRLGTHFTPVLKRARAVPELWSLYLAARDRGLRTRGRQLKARGLI